MNRTILIRRLTKVDRCCKMAAQGQGAKGGLRVESTSTIADQAVSGQRRHYCSSPCLRIIARVVRYGDDYPVEAVRWPAAAPTPSTVPGTPTSPVTQPPGVTPSTEVNTYPTPYSPGYTSNCTTGGGFHLYCPGHAAVGRVPQGWERRRGDGLPNRCPAEPRHCPSRRPKREPGRSNGSGPIGWKLIHLLLGRRFR